MIWPPCVIGSFQRILEAATDGWWFPEKATNGELVMSEAWERQVRCTDSMGRARVLRVIVTEGRLVVQAPPGEVAEINPADVDQMKAYLTSAQLESVQQRGEW